VGGAQAFNGIAMEIQAYHTKDRILVNVFRGLIMRYILIPIISFLALLAAAIAGSASMVSLAYDDSVPEDGVWLGGQLGHGVIFTAPADNWSLSQLKVLGMLKPNDTSETFTIEVWDQNLTLLTRTTDRSDAYFGENMSWAQIDLPEITVSGNFLVCFFEYGSVFTGVDLGDSSGRSVLVSRNPNQIVAWDLKNYSQNQTDWMIEASGKSPEPVFELKVLSDKASEKSPAKVAVKAEDSDGNLVSATLFIVDNKTREAVWSEVKGMKGVSDETELSWPATTFSISSGGEDKGGIYAVRNAETAENVTSLLTYYAPCVTEIEENQSIATKAFFGEDGGLNALVDYYNVALYVSEDLLKVTNPKMDYAVLSQNMSLISGKSKIGFYRMTIPVTLEEQSAEIIGPLLLSGTSSTKYNITLNKHSAGEGEYIALVRVDDEADNQVAEIGEKTIKVGKA